MIQMAIILTCSLSYIVGGDLDDRNGDCRSLFTVLY